MAPAGVPSLPALRAALWLACAAGLVSAQASSWAAVVREAESAGIRTGFVAVDAASGRELASHRASEAFLPASNQKLATTVAFLHRLGSDYRFRTGFRVRDGVLEVVGGGDPNWIRGTEQDPAALFAALAVRLRTAGVEQLRDVRLASGPFGGPSRPAGWPADQFHRTYSAPSGAVLLDQGCWTLRVERGGGSIDAAAELVAPVGGLQLRGSIRLTADRAAGARHGAAARDGWLELDGSFWERGEPREYRGAVDDAEAVFLRALRAGLLRGGLRFEPTAAPGDADLPAIETPLAPALRRVLAESSNIDAEQLLRVLGAETRGDGSFDGGAAAVRDALADLLGELPDGVRIVDGSGLSRDDRLTPQAICTILRAALRAPFADVWRAALARGGERDTTMSDRFRGSPLAARVQAKTGTLRDASALSGIVRVGDRDVAFAILMNWDRRRGGPHPRELQERLVAAIAR